MSNLVKFKDKDEDLGELDTTSVEITVVENGWLVSVETEDDEYSNVFISREELFNFLDGIL